MCIKQKIKKNSVFWDIAPCSLVALKRELFVTTSARTANPTKKTVICKSLTSVVIKQIAKY